MNSKEEVLLDEVQESKKNYETPLIAEQKSMLFPKEVLNPLLAGEDSLFQCFHCSCSTH